MSTQVAAMTPFKAARVALIKVAGFIDDAPELLPLFERLESDLEAIRSKSSALNRARAMARRVQNDMGFKRHAAFSKVAPRP